MSDRSEPKAHTYMFVSGWPGCPARGRGRCPAAGACGGRWTAPHQTAWTPAGRPSARAATASATSTPSPASGSERHQLNDASTL